MPVVSITEAAKLVKRNRKTVQRYVADGRLSLSQNVAGDKGIDTSELMRVFGKMSQDMGATFTATESQLVLEKVSDVPLVKEDVLKAEIEGLKAVIEAQKITVETQKNHISSLENTVRLLEYDRKEGATMSHPWWKFWV
jgi:hypothetical protein